MARRFSFPSPYTVLLGVIVLAALATWLLPAGRYDTLRYDEDRRALVVAAAEGERVLPATQRTLDSLGVRVRLEKLVDDIRRPIAVPGTYRPAAGDPQGLLDVLQAPIQGIYGAIDVILFVLVIGGFIGVVNRSGAFDAGIRALARRLAGREAWLIVIVTVLMALGGSTFGMAEETLAFYPVLVPVFLAAGYDVLVPLAVIFAGSHIGYLASTTNPFATIIASDAAGVDWTDGLYGRLLMLVLGSALCIAYIIRYGRRVRANPAASLVQPGEGDVPVHATATAGEAPARLGGKNAALLALFGLTFVVMIFGVSRLHWWFPEMTALFLGATLVFGVLQRGGERAVVAAFLKGAEDLLGVGFIIGLARGVTHVLTSGGISDTLLSYATGAVSGMPPGVFVVALLVVYFFLTLFISSSSGMAVLTMPIIGALAEVVGVPRAEIVNTYLYGMGLMNFISPTELILPSLAMVRVNYNTWLRFVAPLLALLTGLAVLFLLAGVLF
jgi:uncharacterized ion transporter superfamily protein YfcC